MKINFKKIASVLATTVMLGSTVAFAAAAYPEPFVKSGAADAALVVGANAATTDMAAATDLGASLDAKVTSSTGTVSGTGDQSKLESSRKLYYGDKLSDVKSSISASEMPTVLADGKVVSLSGTEYKYTQSLILGGTVSVFGTSGGDLKDPVLYLDVGTTPATPVYNYTLSFTKNLNVSDSTNIQSQKIQMFGVDYVIGTGSTNTTLYLYGAGETVTLLGGETKTVAIAGKEHVIELVAATATNTAKITVDGISKTVTKGSNYAFAGDINVYAKDITYQSYAGGVQNAELIIGANTLLLQNGQTVKVGADATSLTGTLATITGAAGGEISAITVNSAMKKSQTDHIGIGGSMIDPVFGGLKTQFVKASPDLTDATRAKVKVETDNNQYAYVTFTSARAGTKGEQRLTYVYDNDTAADAVSPQLAHQTISSVNKGRIHVLEGENALPNDWIIVNQGDAGTILNVDDITIDSSTSGTVTFSDAITGDSQKITLTNASSGSVGYQKTGVNFFGGNGYIITANEIGTTVNITWGSVRTLFPRIKMKDGGWIALLAETALKNETAVILPDGQTTLSTSASATINETTALQYNANGIQWGVSDGYNRVQNISNSGIAGCNFNSSKGPAILVIEPKKWNDGSYGDFICVPMVTQGTLEIAIGTPLLNGTDSGFVTFDSDSYKSAAVDKYGTYVTMESRTNENGVANIYIPTSQMTLDVLFTAESVTQGAGKITVVKDTEVSSVSSKNLIVVGGACINKAAAMIVAGTEDALCGDAWASKTGAGAGKYLIQVAASPYNAGKIAMLVAGFEAADTTTAVAKVKEGTIDTSKNSATVYPMAAA